MAGRGSGPADIVGAGADRRFDDGLTPAGPFQDRLEGLGRPLGDVLRGDDGDLMLLEVPEGGLVQGPAADGGGLEDVGIAVLDRVDPVPERRPGCMILPARADD